MALLYRSKRVHEEKKVHKNVEYKEYEGEMTSTDDDHYHYYYMDENGDGETKGTFRASENYLKPGHKHIIKDYKILDFNGHIHTYGNK